MEGDQIQAHTQGGNGGGSDPGPHPRGKLKGIRSRSPPHTVNERPVRILLECILVGYSVRVGQRFFCRNELGSFDIQIQLVERSAENSTLLTVLSKKFFIGNELLTE